MNDPIDILEIAAIRYVKALEWWRVTRNAWGTFDSSIEQSKATASLDVARYDLAATEQLVRELAVIDLHNRA